MKTVTMTVEFVVSVPDTVHDDDLCLEIDTDAVGVYDLSGGPVGSARVSTYTTVSVEGTDSEDDERSEP